MLATAAIIAGAIGLASANRVGALFSAHPTQAECATLLDRYVEHLTYAATPHPTPGALASQKALARSKASEDHAFARCTSELTRAQADCALKAESADAFERCLQ